MNSKDSKERFSDKVAEYVKYRPNYPQTFIEYLINEVGVSPASTVADVGAGTGILTKQLGEKVNRIIAVEPNAGMRAACIEHCRDLKNFAAVAGSAEDTTLPDHAVDFIAVAQAFHWFDRSGTKREFGRILKAGGRVILVWNTKEAESGLTQETETLFRRVCPEFKGFSDGREVRPEAYADFFKDGRCDYRVFDNNLSLTLERFIGSNLSTSYAPAPDDDNYPGFVAALTGLFEKYSHNGQLLLPNKTHSYVGEV